MDTADVVRIPRPRWRVPVVGDVIGASTSAPLQDTMRLARQLGPIFERKFFGRVFVCVSGADLVAELSDESRFAKHVLPGMVKLREIAGDGLFTAYNDEPNWRKAHDILRPAFTQSAMRGYHPTMLAVAKQLVERWDAVPSGGRVDVTADMTKLTLETIGRTGFGYEFASFNRERPHPFVTAMLSALRHAQRNTLRPPLVGDLLFRWADRRYAKDSAFMAEVVDEVIRARKAAGDRSADDLLGLMLNTAHPDSDEPLDEVNIRNQVITFLVAGHETTSGALSFALHYLSLHPEVAARARAEVDAEWGSADPTFEQVAKLRYVRRVFDEALRLWPTAPAFARQARQDTVLGGRYPMARGQWALVLIPMLHRDPVWGENVEQFDPDRFEPQRTRSRPPHVFKPWGAGERSCIGRQFALHEAILVLGMLLQRYEFHPQPDYRLKVTELLTLKPQGLYLTLDSTKRAAHP